MDPLKALLYLEAKSEWLSNNTLMQAIQKIYTVMRRLTTGIRSEKCVVRRFGLCANVIECTYTNLDSTV